MTKDLGYAYSKNFLPVEADLSKFDRFDFSNLFDRKHKMCGIYNKM